MSLSMQAGLLKIFLTVKSIALVRWAALFRPAASRVAKLRRSSIASGLHRSTSILVEVLEWRRGKDIQTSNRVSRAANNLMYHSRFGCDNDSCTNVLSAIIPTSLLRCLSGPESQIEPSHTFDGAGPLGKCPAAIIDTTLRTRIKPASRLCFDLPTTYFLYLAVYFE